MTLGQQNPNGRRWGGGGVGVWPKRPVDVKWGKSEYVDSPVINSHNFFHADINQSEVEDSFQLSSDYMKSARQNVNKSKAVTLLGSLL